jgi:hypothetical protein
MHDLRLVIIGSIKLQIIFLEQEEDVTTTDFL